MLLRNVFHLRELTICNRLMLIRLFSSFEDDNLALSSRIGREQQNKSLIQPQTDRLLKIACQCSPRLDLDV